MTYKVNASRLTPRTLKLEGNSSCSLRGADVSEYQTFSTFGLGAGGGRRAFSLNSTKLPAIQPINRSKDSKTFNGSLLVERTKNLNKDDRYELENGGPGRQIFGTDFLFDLTRMRLERNRAVIPPLSRDAHVYRPTYLHPFSFSKDLSHGHAGESLALGYNNPGIILPPALVLTGRNSLSIENCKLSRPRVNCLNDNPMTIKDNQKWWSYPDPIAGAPSSFIHRVLELSSLEGETVKQEKLKKIKKCKKPPS